MPAITTRKGLGGEHRLLKKFPTDIRTTWAFWKTQPDVFGDRGAIKSWLHRNATDVFILAAGGAKYAIPVGLVLGVVIGLALLLTQVWSRKPVFA
jgi:hypothetical protein